MFEDWGMAESTGSKFKKLASKADLSFDVLAKGMGYAGASSIQRYLADEFEEPLPLKVAKKAAKAMAGRGGVVEADVLALAGIETANVRPAPNPLVHGSAALPLDVPVFGTAVGGSEGDFSFSGTTIDYVRRPPGISPVRQIYALFVRGSSMAPWREEGELIFEDPARPPRFGDYVVIELHPARSGEPGPAYVKRFIGKTPTKLKLLQFNPSREIELALDKIIKLHRVIPQDDLLGI
jgi:phage repressor protein C with HTH and peptisase S24 domain